jgi:ferredoxin-NADP reductase
MARAAVLGRLSWLVADVTDVRPESATAKTLLLDVPGWPGHLPGQHVDVRLTASDGYSAERSYSIANAPDGTRIELTVDEVPDGEVSPYLAQVLAPGHRVELRGPIGGWFVWRPEQTEPVLLVGGGSGLVPLMAMIRTRAAAGSRAPMRLLYSVRTPDAALYRDELRRRVRSDTGLEVTYAWTRRPPEDWPQPPGRIGPEELAAAGWPAEVAPACYVCGPTPFVEALADLLVLAGHDPARIRTERFGPTGGRR